MMLLRDNKQPGSGDFARSDFVEFKAHAEHDVNRHRQAFSRCTRGSWMTAEKTVKEAITSGRLRPVHSV